MHKLQRALLAVSCLWGLSASVCGKNLSAARAQLYTSAATVPERLLRLSIQFKNAPDAASLGAVELRDAQGHALADALLPDDLWSPDGRTLTKLLTPARVKSGLAANLKEGRPLVSGQTLGVYLGEREVGRWQVESGGCGQPEPGSWVIEGARTGTWDALRLQLPSPIAWQSRELIAVVAPNGQRMAGQSNLVRGETEWRFTPRQPWVHGTYTIKVHPRLESPCGDEMGEPFEHDSAKSLGAVRATQTLEFVR